MPKGIDCNNCCHFWGVNACDAYPEGIPGDIFKGLVTHNKVMDGQKGTLVYWPLEKLDAYLKQMDKKDE